MVDVPPAHPRRRYRLQRRIGFSSLRFIAELETEFRATHGPYFLSRARVLASLLTIAPLVLLATGDWPQRLEVMHGLLDSLLMLCVFAAISPMLLALHPRGQTLAYPALASAVTVIALTLAAGSVLVRLTDPVFALPGVLLAVALVYSAGLWTRHALPLGLLISALFLAASSAWSPDNMMWRADLLGLLLMNAIGLASRYRAEHESREAFLVRQELSFDALYDPLTGLLNRRAFKRMAQSVWAQAARESRSVGVALLDLDHFKQVNDQHGHLAGDRVLVGAATALRQRQRRPLDLTGRFGGDELIAIWYDVNREWLQKMLEELHARMLASDVDVAGARLPLRTSIGAVVMQPSPQSDLLSALRQADACLYDVKRGGRGRVRVLTTPMPTSELRGGVSRILMR